MRNPVTQILVALRRRGHLTSEQACEWIRDALQAHEPARIEEERFDWATTLAPPSNGVEPGAMFTVVLVRHHGALTDEAADEWVISALRARGVRDRTDARMTSSVRMTWRTEPLRDRSPVRAIVPVRCWSGIEPIDEELAPVIEAWNGTGWLVTHECCSGHGEVPGYITFTLSLTRLPDLVALVRGIEAQLPRVKLTLEILHPRAVIGALWTKDWGSFDLTFRGTSETGALTRKEMRDFVALARHPRSHGGHLDRVSTIPKDLRTALGPRPKSAAR
jgi:hypothetical protein